MILKICGLGYSPQAALDSPRRRLDPEGGLWLELGFPADSIDGLTQMGYEIKIMLEFMAGGGKIIIRTDDGTVQDRILGLMGMRLYFRGLTIEV